MRSLHSLSLLLLIQVTHLSAELPTASLPSLTSSRAANLDAAIISSSAPPSRASSSAATLDATSVGATSVGATSVDATSVGATGVDAANSSAYLSTSNSSKREPPTLAAPTLAAPTLADPRLADWLGAFKVGETLAYRQANFVGLIQLKSLQPLEWRQAEIESVFYLAKPDPSYWIDQAKTSEAFNPGETLIWTRLLDLPLKCLKKRLDPKREWHPKLALLSELKGELNWSLWQLELPTEGQTFGNLRTLTLYVAEGEALKAANLPSPWPYWMENHETLHKWVLYLVGFQRPQLLEKAPLEKTIDAHVTPNL